MAATAKLAARTGGAKVSATTHRLAWRGKLRSGFGALGAAGAPDHALSFTAIAVATAFLLLLMPSGGQRGSELAAAAILGALLLGLALAWEAAPRLAGPAVPLGYIALAALLRDGAGGSASGFGGLFLLPVLWLALTAGRRMLTLGLGAMFLAQLLPLVLIGEPAYPKSGWRAIVVLTSVAAITGLMVQHLVGEARRRASLLQAQAADLERASARLAQQNERLLELDRMKDELIAVVSHELRTPLTSISGYLDLALAPDETLVPQTRERYLSTVRRNVDRLTSLVNDLLFLARNDSHPLELEPCPVDLAQVLDEAAETAAPAAEERRIELTVEAESPLHVLADRRRLLQLIDNLVSNALKFTLEGGRVRLAARRDADSVFITVTDSGVGISPDDLPRLFDRFYRASTATGNAIPGTGLGLAISQVIAEAHGSTIRVESTPGEGTTFELALPATDPPARNRAGAATAIPRAAKGARAHGRSSWARSARSRGEV